MSISLIGWRTSVNKVRDTSSFISKAIKVYGDIYDYGKTEYVASKKKTTITCKIHGDWETLAYNHLRGRGCPKCNYNNREKRLKTNSEFINDARRVHGDTYSYKNTNYKGDRAKVVVTCKVHGDFSQTAGQHLQRKGCPKCGDIINGCSRKQFKRRCIKNNKGFGTLYLIVCYSDFETFYKIGITSTSIEKRFSSYNMPYEYEVIRSITLSPEKVYDLESSLMKDLSAYRYRPKQVFGGYTECFSELPIILERWEKVLFNE